MINTAHINKIYFRINSTPKEGVYISGLFIEGARWNVDAGILEEQFSKVLVGEMPIIHLVVSSNYNIDEKFLNLVIRIF